MPVFDDYDCLFVHIPKNAGRSVEQILLGPDISPDDGRRSLLNGVSNRLRSMTMSKLPKTHLLGTLDYTLVAQHLTYAEMDVLNLLPKPKRRSFAICRNPYDRAISSVLHHFNDRKTVVELENAAHFERLLTEWLDSPTRDHNQLAHRRKQFDYVINRYGVEVVDHVLRFETLPNDFNALFSEWGYPGLALPWRGKSTRLRSYSDYYTSHARKVVETHYGQDIDHFKYMFNP